jgi:hypothetical protein
MFKNTVRYAKGNRWTHVSGFWTFFVLRAESQVSYGFNITLSVSSNSFTPRGMKLSIYNLAFLTSIE